VGDTWVSIEFLRQELKNWESQAPYPTNEWLRERAGRKGRIVPAPGPLMVPASAYINGQAFFPGGDGRYRESSQDEQLRRPSDEKIAKRGLMIGGNDFGKVSD
jgi:hypothetical protein